MSGQLNVMTLVLAAGALASCATTQLARPVGSGNTRAALSLGGPMVAFGGAPVPLPVTTLGLAHGLSDLVDLQADVHLTSLAFGIVGADVGFAVHPVPRHRSALTLGGTLNYFGNGADATLFADLWLATGMQATRWLWLGAGLHHGLRLGTTSREVAEQTAWMPTPFALLAFRISRRVEIELEGRWYAVNNCGNCVAPAYYSVANQGALGVLLGLTWTSGGGRP